MKKAILRFTYQDMPRKKKKRHKNSFKLGEFAKALEAISNSGHAFCVSVKDMTFVPFNAKEQ